MRPIKNSSESGFWLFLHSFTLHYSKFTICSLHPSCGDLQSKNVRAGWQANGKSTESTFPSRFSNQSIFPRVLQNTFRSERLHFPVEKVFSHAHNDFEHSHLTPMVTSQNHPENQISKPLHLASVHPRRKHLVIETWSLVIQNPRPKST